MNRQIEGPEDIDEQEVLSAEESEEAFRPRQRSSSGTADIMKILQNPSALGQAFSLTDEQLVNVKALISGMGTAAGVRYLSNMFGSEISAGIGGIVSAMVAKKMFGGR